VGDALKLRGNVTSKPKCFNASKWLTEFPNSPWVHYKRFSQGNQDGVMMSLFSPEQLGTTNKGFVEFGFPDTSFATSYGNGHNLVEDMGFHAELLLDGGNENPYINLHKHFLTKDNIVPIFKKYNVSKEPDYVSVDIDSCDIWLFMAITSTYRPRLMTVEYNSKYGINNYQAMNCKHDYTWGGDNLYGASLSALYLAGQRRKYTMVYATPKLDTFFVRDDLVCPGTAPPLSAFTYATELWMPYHDYTGYPPAEAHLVDFKSWLAKHPQA